MATTSHSGPRIALLCGAGLSTGAGIPDFRGPDGVWTKDPKAELVSTLEHFLTDPEVRRRAWQLKAASPIWEAEPTPAHRAIADAAADGRAVGIITQNTDGLQQLAGTPDDLVHEIHGSSRTWRCEGCGVRGDMADVIADIRSGAVVDPLCPACGGIIRAETILFGEALREDVLDACIAVAEDCDVLIAVGTSLGVYPAAALLPLAVDSGARGIIVNAEPTELDDVADEVIAGDIQVELPALLARI